jgi:energy-coupling factor transport system permease protein
MDYFLYLDRGTWAHRLDPRMKILAVGGVFLIALLFSDPRYLLIPMGLMLGLFHASRSMTNLRRLSLLIVLPCLYCVLLWPLFVSGTTPWITVRTRVITEEAVLFGMGMGLRLAVMVLAGLWLLSSTTIEDLAQGLQRMGLPAPVCSALSLAFRWVPTLIGSAGLVVEAQRSRGLDLKTGNWFSRAKRYPPLLIPLIGHTLRHTHLLAMALESKGFGPGRHRHALHDLTFKRADRLFGSVVLTVVLVSIWLRATGHGVLLVHF